MAQQSVDAVFALAFSPLAVGLALVLPHTNAAVATAIGTGLIGGAFIGLVFALVQYTMDKRNTEVDKETDLRLLLTSSRDLPGIDLSGRSLRGIYLQGKSLQGPCCPELTCPARRSMRRTSKVRS